MKAPSSTLYVAHSESRGFTRTVRVALHPVPTFHTALCAHEQCYPFRIIWFDKPISSYRPLDYVDEWRPSCLGSGFEAWIRDPTTKYEATFEEAVAWLQGADWPLKRVKKMSRT